MNLPSLKRTVCEHRPSLKRETDRLPGTTSIFRCENVSFRENIVEKLCIVMQCSIPGNFLMTFIFEPGFRPPPKTVG